GNTMTVYTFWSADIDQHERTVHNELHKFNICRELFSVDCLPNAINICHKVCSSDVVTTQYNGKGPNVQPSHINYIDTLVDIDNAEKQPVEFTPSTPVNLQEDIVIVDKANASSPKIETLASIRGKKYMSSFEWIASHLPDHTETSGSYRKRYLAACENLNMKSLSIQDMSKYIYNFRYIIKSGDKCKFWAKTN